MINTIIINKIHTTTIGLSLTVYDSLAKRYMQSTTRKPIQKTDPEEKLREPLPYKDMTEDVQESRLTSNSLLDTDFRSSGESLLSNSNTSYESEDDRDQRELDNKSVQSNQSADHHNSYFLNDTKPSSKQDVTDNTDGNQYDPTGNAKGKEKVEDVDKADTGTISKVKEAMSDVFNWLSGSNKTQSKDKAKDISTKGESSTVKVNENNPASNQVFVEIRETAKNNLGEAETQNIIEQYSLEDKARIHNAANDFATENRKDSSMAERLPFKDTSKEIIALDGFLKVTVSQLDAIADKVGIQIEKSQELTSKWESIKTKLDAYIKSLEGVNYKKAFTYLGCTAAIVYFTYQMGIYRKLPELMISIASNIPMPSFSGKDVPMPKPSIESTFNKIMEVPLTPVTIVTGVGSIVTIMGIVRASIWIIRKLRK